MATAPSTDEPLNLREQIARIDKVQAEIVKIKVDTRIAPITAAMAGAGAAAALIAATATLTKLMFG